ncbi:carbon storage regulator [Caballeronia zhejiangensis]|uniref:Carbon storage regulator n=1 Tax=Caballeronia zhejiangensis TaxID=871203 RepID=A0A656QCI8_9BURK|nr:carbon storage regulator [Caballeronia zhejiangensis]KDR25957.1 hypothetical protein BG60_26445 [Caballeronia zhejiangensis]
MLKIDLKPGESVEIGSGIIVTLEEKSGQLARLAFQAPKSVPIKRVQSASPAQVAASYGLSGRE